MEIIKKILWPVCVVLEFFRIVFFTDNTLLSGDYELLGITKWVTGEK